MIEQPAQVMEIDADRVLVRTEPQSGCHSCSAQGGCGTSLIGRLFPERPRHRIALALQDFPQRPRVGDHVLLGIAENQLQQTGLLLYALPLAGLIGGAVLGSAMHEAGWLALAADPSSMLFGGVGFVLALGLARRAASAREHRMQKAVKVLHLTPVGIPVEIASDNMRGCR